MGWKKLAAWPTFGGDDCIILVKLRDAIHLNGKQYRDAILLQFTRQGDGFRAPSYARK